MIHWKIKNNTIHQLFADKSNLIFPWGIETADSSAFFSMEEGVGYRYRVLEQERFSDEKSFFCRIVVEMYEGLWELTTEDSIDDDGYIRRKAYLNCLKESCFMDFVMRFRFDKSFFNRAVINNREIEHLNKNLYHQYQVDQTTLFGSTWKVSIHVLNSQMPSSLQPFMYVRDHNNEWVVHARMLPCKWDKEVIKLCNEWAKTRPLPQLVSNSILKIPAVKKALWYRGENSPYTNPIAKRVNPQACPIVKLNKGDKLMWELGCKIEKTV